MKKTMVHVALWLAVFSFWIFASRNNHPTLLLNSLASLTLVAASAGAVYAFSLGLLPRYRAHHSKLRLCAELLVVMAVLIFSAVLLIQYAYDALWGPDPARFGFWVNVALETTFIGLHLLFSVVVTWLGKATRR